MKEQKPPGQLARPPQKRQARGHALQTRQHQPMKKQAPQQVQPQAQQQKSTRKFDTNDFVEVPNGMRYYVAGWDRTSDGRWGYRMSMSRVPNACGVLNIWYIENQLQMIERNRKK